MDGGLDLVGEVLVLGGMGKDSSSESRARLLSDP